MGVRRGGIKGAVTPSKWFFPNVFYLGGGACFQINPYPPPPLMEILYTPLNEARYEKIVESSDTNTNSTFDAKHGQYRQNIGA